MTPRRLLAAMLMASYVSGIVSGILCFSSMQLGLATLGIWAHNWFVACISASTLIWASAPKINGLAGKILF
ncbi:MAG: hypothetical protein V4805_19060 [Pseudomonadota bacterium]